GGRGGWGWGWGWKCPTAREGGAEPALTVELVASGKAPVPSPKRIVTLLELKLATARSGLPSPLKSPTATDKGLVPAPTVELVALGKAPVPSPKRIVTVPSPQGAASLAEARPVGEGWGKSPADARIQIVQAPSAGLGGDGPP